MASKLIRLPIVRISSPAYDFEVRVVGNDEDHIVEIVQQSNDRIYVEDLEALDLLIQALGEIRECVSTS